MSGFAKCGVGAGDAFAALHAMHGYQRLSAKDQKAVRDLIGKELKRFRAKVASVDQRGRLRREEAARVPDWTPAELAKAAMEVKQ